MRTFIDVIRKRPINLLLIIFVCICYEVNNKFLKNNTEGLLNHFLICYFNDLLCPLLLLSYCNMLLLTKEKELNRLIYIIGFIFLAGLIWEFVAPLIKTSSVCDVIDLLCYVIGGVFYWALLKIYTRSIKYDRN